MRCDHTPVVSSLAKMSEHNIWPWTLSSFSENGMRPLESNPNSEHQPGDGVDRDPIFYFDELTFLVSSTDNKGAAIF